MIMLACNVAALAIFLAYYAYCERKAHQEYKKFHEMIGKEISRAHEDALAAREALRELRREEEIERTFNDKD